MLLRSAGDLVRFMNYTDYAIIHDGIVESVNVDMLITEGGARRTRYNVCPLDTERFGYDGLISRYHPYSPFDPNAPPSQRYPDEIIILEGGKETLAEEKGFELIPPTGDPPGWEEGMEEKTV
jgi:hypothetical protein